MTLPRIRSVLIVVVIVACMAAPAIIVALRASQGSAAFSADVSLGRNEVTSAVIDIEIGDLTVPIVAADLAPGDVRRGSIELVNDGTVALLYSLRGAEVGADNRELASFLTWRSFWSTDDATCADVVPSTATTVDGSVLGAGGQLLGDRAPGLDPGDRVLVPGERDLLCLEVSFALDAPNQLQSASLVQPIIADAEQSVDVPAITPSAEPESTP